MRLPMPKPQQRAKRGFTFLEVTLAMVVFLMMTLIFAAVFPIAARSAQQSANYSQAALIAQHKIDQLRASHYSGIHSSGDISGNLVSLGIIDQTYGHNVAGPYSFATVDSLTTTGTVHGFFPVGTTATITIADASTTNTGAGIPAGKLDYVTVTIVWPSIGKTTGTYTLSAIN